MKLCQLTDFKDSQCGIVIINDILVWFGLNLASFLKPDHFVARRI